MAQITTEDTAETIANLITRIRRAVGDTDTSTTNQRWADAEVIDALNLEIFKMTAEQGLGNISSMLTSANVSYTGGSEYIALGAAATISQVFMVEDITDTSNPIRLEFSSILDANMDFNAASYLGAVGRSWSRVGANIAIRPVPSTTITLRVWYIRAPYGTSTSYGGSDQQPFMVQHEELLSLGAAIRLQETDAEIPPGRVERYQDLWQRFVRSKYQNRGPIYVRSNRKYR